MKKSLLIALLVGLGIQKATAEKMAANTPEDGGTIEQPEIDTLLTAWKAEQIALMENEPTLVQKIKDAEKARHFSEFERKIKQTFGLTAEEIKDKKFDEIIALAKQKASVTGDKTTEQLQTEILNLTNENKRLMEEEIPKVRKEVDDHKKKINIEQILAGKVPNSEDKLRIPYETALRLAKMDLFDKYDVDLDDKGEPVLKVKGSDLKPKSTDGTKFLTLDDAINESLAANKALKESNAGGGAGAGKTGKDGKPITIEKEQGEEGAEKKGNKLFLSAAEQHLANLQAEDAAREAANK